MPTTTLLFSAAAWRRDGAGRDSGAHPTARHWRDTPAAKTMARDQRAAGRPSDMHHRVVAMVGETQTPPLQEHAAVGPSRLSAMLPPLGRLDLWDSDNNNNSSRHHAPRQGNISETAAPLTVRRSNSNNFQQEPAMDDDELLDDESLDLLVTTLARETARIEALAIARSRVLHSHQQIKTEGLHQGNEKEDEDEDSDADDDAMAESDNQHGEYSSEESSYRSTSSSGTTHLPGTQKQRVKRVRRACIVPNCGKRSRSMGFCIAHGGGRRCAIAGCDKSSQGGNLCIKHGGGKRCRVDGCEKAAQTNLLCKAHGGGPRCQFEDCEKSSQGGGYCRQHGGGKRCAFQGCMKGTQRGSYCALHGGSRLCIVEGCNRNDRGGGYCAHHGGGKRCSVDGCNRPTRRNALCSTHLRLLGQQELHDTKPREHSAAS